MLGLLAIFCSMANAEPYRPTDPNAVLVRVPDRARSAAPMTPLQARELAQRGLALGRMTLDERHFRAITTASRRAFRLLPADAS